MKWRKVSDYCIQCGSYRIARVSVAGHPMYSAFHEYEFLGWHETADEARNAAKRHSEGKR